MRGKINVETLSTQEIVQKYEVSRTTAWRAKERGWLFVDYHKPIEDYTDETVTKVGIEIAKNYGQLLKSLQKKYCGVVSYHTIEDALSESILRCLERSKETIELNINPSARVYSRACFIIRATNPSKV